MKLEHPNLYEINTAVWLYELSQQYSRRITLGNVSAEKWDELENLGFNYIWLMGVWKRSRAGFTIFQGEPGYEAFKSLCDSILPGWTEDDLIGSPYSITSYSPDPIIGDWEDIDRARKEINKRGMGLILDFVPNHTAPDHPWVTMHPEYYILGRENDYRNDPALFTVLSDNKRVRYVMRGKDPYFPPWTDTVQLNYFNSDLRRAMIRQLKDISRYCDGVRCDMAMLVLNDIFFSNWQNRAQGGEENVMTVPEFWQDARQAVPDLLLIAEAYWDTEWRLQQLGFDYTYDKRLYDKMLSSSPQDVYIHLQSSQSYQRKLVRFIENHDEQRSVETFSHRKLQAAAVLFSTLPGMKLYYHGQLDGKRTKTPVQLRREPQEDVDREVRAFYETLVSVTSRDVFHNGIWSLHEVLPLGGLEETQLIAYSWKLEDRTMLVVVNLTSESSGGNIYPGGVDADRDYLFRDDMSEERFRRKGSVLARSGLNVSLEAFHFHIFDMRKEY